MHLHKFLVLIAGTLVVATPALADPPWAREGGERHGKHEKHGKSERHGSRNSFDGDDYRVVRDFYGRNPGFVPPGLAKKGGVPPGLAKKGEVLDEKHQHLLLPLPSDLEKLLPPPPHEVIRRIIGRDIVLVQKQTNKVLDVLHNALP